MLAPWKKSYDKYRQHIKKQRHHFANKVSIVKAMVFPVVIHGCESWTIKKTECWRIDAFELWCWRRLLRVPWIARRSNQSILREINPEYSLEGLRTDAEAPILWPPDAKNWLIEKDPDAGKRLKAGGEGDDRGWGGWMASPTQWTWVWENFMRWWRTGKPGVLQSMELQRDGHDLVTEQQYKKYITLMAVLALDSLNL